MLSQAFNNCLIIDIPCRWLRTGLAIRVPMAGAFTGPHLQGPKLDVKILVWFAAQKGENDFYQSKQRSLAAAWKPAPGRVSG